jgi:hypothetical protein
MRVSRKLTNIREYRNPDREAVRLLAPSRGVIRVAPSGGSIGAIPVASRSCGVSSAKGLGI